MYHIAILVPVCSRKQNYTTLSSTPFMKILYPSFLKYKDDGYKFSFYVGYDSSDHFYKQHIQNLTNIVDETVDIKIYELEGCEHKPARAWNILFKNAVLDDCDYFYQIGDDVQIESPWTNVFVNILQENNNVGVVGGCHLLNYRGRIANGKPPVIENAFVHKKHYHIFGTFFDERIDNWFCDDWITEVYKPDNSIHINDIFVKNLVMDRYQIKNINNEIQKYIRQGKENLGLFNLQRKCSRAD
jgi:hypothetical protein